MKWFGHSNRDGFQPQAVDPIVTRLFKSYVRSRRWPAEDSCEAGGEGWGFHELFLTKTYLHIQKDRWMDG